MVWDKDIGLIIINILMLIICLLMFRKKADLGSYGKYMIAAMVLTYLIDTVVFFLRVCTNIHFIYRTYIYIFGGLGLFFFIIFLMYQQIINHATLKKIAQVSTVLFCLFYIYKVSTITLSDGFPEEIFFFNVFLLLFVIALFLLDTFKSNIIFEINHYYPFWFSLGLIVIYVGMVPSIIISKVSASMMMSGLWSFITFVINLVGYGILFFGLLKAKKVIR